MNDKVWIILFTFVIDINCVNGFSYGQAYHTQSKTWAAASDECDSKELEFDENVLMKTDVLWDKEFRIGMAIYPVTTPWIEVIKVKELTKMCSCLHENGSSNSIKNCIEQNSSTHFFVYKVFSGIVADYDNGNCTTVYCFGGTNGLTAVNCNYQNDETASTCNNGSIVGWGKSYSISKQICLISYQLLVPPETYCRLKGHINEAHYAWTNVFRAETEAKLTQGPVFSTTSKPSLAAVQTPAKISSTKHSSGVQYFKPGESSTTISSESKIATKTMEKNSSVSFDKGPIIGGIAGAIAFLAVLVVIIICKIRYVNVCATVDTCNWSAAFDLIEIWGNDRRDSNMNITIKYYKRQTMKSYRS